MNAVGKLVVALVVFGLIATSAMAWSPASATNGDGDCDRFGCDAGPDRCAIWSPPGGGKLECFDFAQA